MRARPRLLRVWHWWMVKLGLLGPSDPAGQLMDLQMDRPKNFQMNCLRGGLIWQHLRQGLVHLLRGPVPQPWAIRQGGLLHLLRLGRQNRPRRLAARWV